ncbi:DUF4270 family protein [Zeaxanthinibacter sp. PT1]|uniref:DUF4270 domain-containing protein n=1 Tax=Zeaxanthinibacter TaxID=561554 RepID=UPI0023491968|nr:DUF4270 family protein [Zeaxanthinibacter sp. PT1]MDC6351037.1 DUF4270 family protein [Zeaxanthinibacter sp. PT1]
MNRIMPGKIFAALAILTALTFVVSCDEDPTTIGATVTGGQPFNTDRAVYDVFAYNRNIIAAQTNKLPLYQLGVYNDPVYGQTRAKITTQVQLSNANPIFGSQSQENESTPENETVKEVILYMPFLQNNTGDEDRDGVPDVFDADPTDANSDSDGDTLTDIAETNSGTDPLNEDTDGDGIRDDVDTETIRNNFPKRVDLDSIYGNRDIPFNLKVTRSTYFLRDLDPNTNFQQAQPYYSNQDLTSFAGEVLFDGQVTITEEETVIFEEDDPDTEEDESTIVDERIQPGIRVALDPAFFQQNILDKEGSSELLSSSNFKEFFRGLHFEVEPGTEELLMLLDLTSSNITIEYEYDNASDEEDDMNESSFTLNFLTGGGTSPVNGNALNTLISDAYPASISDDLDSGNNASRIYLKGGAGTYANIRLFDTDNGDALINQIKANNWIINEANLVFYVDRTAIPAGANEPPRLYIFNAETNAPLYDAINDVSTENTPLGVLQTHDGILVEEDDKGLKYTIRITEHINNIVVRDSANAMLGLTLTSDIRLTTVRDVLLPGDTMGEIPEMSVISPLGTVLYGSEVPASEEKKLKLEIFYTETN